MKGKEFENLSDHSNTRTTNWAATNSLHISGWQTMIGTIQWLGSTHGLWQPKAWVNPWVSKINVCYVLSSSHLWTHYLVVPIIMPFTTRCYASSVHAVIVCLCVCHAGIVSNWLNWGSRKHCHTLCCCRASFVEQFTVKAAKDF